MGYTDEMEKLKRSDSKLKNSNSKLKNPLTKKMRLRVWGYSMGEYLYMLSKSSLTLKYKTYAITSQENELEECEKEFGREFSILGRRKRKRKGGFLGAIPAQVGTQLLGLVNKIFGGRRKKIRFQRRRRIRRRKKMPTRNNILLIKKAVPKRVQLPDGRVFYAKYERIGRENLPPNINVRRTYT